MQVLYRVLLTKDGVQRRSFAMPDHDIWCCQQVFKMCVLTCGKPLSPKTHISEQAYPCSVCSSPNTSSSAAQLGAARMRTTVRGDSMASCGNVHQGLPGLEPGSKLATYRLSGSYCSHSHFLAWPATLMISLTAGGSFRLHLRNSAGSHLGRRAAGMPRCEGS